MTGPPTDALIRKVVVGRVEVISSDVLELGLVPASEEPLPHWTPGAHIDLHLGSGLIRQYSLCGDPDDRSSWSVAVRRDPASRGGSQWVHDAALVGCVLDASVPRNTFPLQAAREHLFLAGGIGITPFLPMVEAVASTATRAGIAFGGPTDLLAAFAPRLRGVPGLEVELRDASDGPLPLTQLLAAAKPGTAVYCCGPPAMIEATRALVQDRDDLLLSVEQFTPAVFDTAHDRPMTVELARSRVEIEVPADQSILDALTERQVFVASSCREGTCGSCEVAVLGGRPAHRDSVIDPDDPDRDLSMMICVSRALSDRLVLDI